MEIKYVPFLKSKPSEIHAVAELSDEISSIISPFFDFPRRKGETADSLEGYIERLAKKLARHLKRLPGFYFDIYDIDDGIEIDGKNIYKFLLESFSNLPVVPVMGIDRGDPHNRSVVDAKKSGIVRTDTVAFRVTHEDFQSFRVVKDEIEETLEDALTLFQSVDLVFDCRLCSNANSGEIAKMISEFHDGFAQRFSVRRVVVTGSSIPPSASDILRPYSHSYVNRTEVDIFRAVRKSLKAPSLRFGDYTTVSPNYSEADIPPEQMQNRLTAKLTYSFADQHYFVRGGSLKTKGRSQYFDLAEELCGKHFFRKNNSLGDIYFEEKGKRIGKECYPNTVIKPSINSHITHIAQQILANGSV